MALKMTNILGLIPIMRLNGDCSTYIDPKTGETVKVKIKDGNATVEPIKLLAAPKKELDQPLKT